MQTSHANPHVSLFPFLPVLLATMGILIVMLVWVVKATSIKTTATNQQQREQLEAEAIALQDDIDLQIIRRDALMAARPELIEQLRQARLARANVQSALEELNREMALIAEQWVSLQKTEKDAAEQKLTEQTFAALRREKLDRIAAAKERLEQQRLQSNERPKLYSIVPTPHVGGTPRRPIYVECTAEGLVLQPLGIHLKTSEMPVPGLPGNPLDAALSTIREYWLRYGSPETEGNPYPLLVVRPAGAGTYGLARRALTSWVDEFGYELVEEDLPLDFGPVDEPLRDAVAKAVERAKKEQFAHAKFLENLARQQAAAREVARIDVGHGLQADRINGGFVRTGLGEESSARGAGISPARATSPPAPSADYELQTTSAGERTTRQKEMNSAAEGDLARSFKSAADEQGRSAYVRTHSLQPIAHQRGPNWAIPNSHGVSYRRPIRVICAQDHLVVNGGRLSLVAPERIDFSDDVFLAVEPLVNHVQRLIESWGPPPPDGHWRPELRFTVIGDAHAVERQLSQLLYESGMEWVGDQP